MSTINAQTIINEVMAAHAVAPDESTSFISFRTSAKGLHRIQDCKENLQRFADLVRKNAAAFGGGLIREAKPRPAVSWPTNLISLFKQSIEDHDYQAALDIGEKLGALFFVTNKGQALMQVAPVPCDFEPRLSSVCNEDGTFAVIFPQNMTSLSGFSYKAKRARQSQIDNVTKSLNARTNFNLSEALDKQSYAPVDQAATRAQWILEHGLSAEVIESRIVAHETESIEAMAAQDVSQVVAQAVATIAISEAMQASEADAELVTCEAGESESHVVTVGSVSGATWAPVPQYVPCSPDKTGFNDGPAPAFRGDDGDTPTPPPAEFLGDATPPVTISSASFAGDIPLSLAVSAYNGVSMSPERRGQSAKSEYAATMASDYETMHAQAVKGGTLNLLPEVFARYRARQSSAYKAYLSSSSRCVSSFIAGPSNFPAARMNKRSDIAHKRLGEYLNGGQMALQAACRTLRPDLRAIMAGDADAVDRLTVEISQADRLQNQMKAVNKAIRTHAKAGEAHQVAALMEIGYSEAQAVEILHPAQHWRSVGFPSYRLTNNQANIRRMRARLEQITAAKARPVESVECANGVTLEDDAPSNRVRLFFPGKPSEGIRDELKSSGFRWAPSVGAWQAYRNRGTLATAKRLAGEPVQAEESAQDAAPEAEIVPVVEIEAMAPAVESQPMSPVVGTPETMDAESEPVKSGVHPEVADSIARHGIAAYGPLAQAEILAKLESAKQAQDVPALETPKGQQVIGKLGKWSAYLYTWHDGKPWMTFEATSGAYECNGYDNARERMKALQALAKAADAPTDTPPGGGLPCPEPVASVAPTPTVAVSSASPTPRVAVSSDFEPVDCDHEAMEATYKAMSKADASASKEIAATAHAKAMVDLAAQYPQLKRAENTYAGGKLAAANMRILLKAAFKGVKFSVTSDYNSVRVNWTDGPSDKQVNEVIGLFDIGASDSQSDYFYTVSTAFSQLFGGVQYLFTRREVSDSLVQVAIDRLYADRIERPTVTDYRKCAGIFDWNSQNYENRQMREMLETLGK